MELTFEQLPSAVLELSQKLDKVLLFLNSSASTPSATPADEILTVHGAAELLHIEPATIYSKVSKKEIPHSKQGGKLYFSKNELTDWATKGGKVKTAQEIAVDASNYSRRQSRRA